MPEPEQSEAKYSEENRLIRINTILSDTELLLERFSGTEELSRPFEFQVTMLSTDFSVDLKSLLRTPVTITLSLFDETERKFNGVFSSLRQKGLSEQDFVYYEGVIVPQMWFLSLDSNCRIFQTMSVPDIVEQILQENNISNFQFRAPLRDNSRYPKRDYCVQYRESSLNFISRLLEEEGIFYWFTHTDQKHTIVFGDNSPALGACPGQASALYSFSKSGWVKDRADSVIGLERIEEAYTGKVQLTDYNFETPTTNLKTKVGEKNEQDYDYPGKYADLDEGARYAGIRLDERERDQLVVRGVEPLPFVPPGVFLQAEGALSRRQEPGLFPDFGDARSRGHHLPGWSGHRHGLPQSLRGHTQGHPLPSAAQDAQADRAGLTDGLGGGQIRRRDLGRQLRAGESSVLLGSAGHKERGEFLLGTRVSQIWAGKNWGWMTHSAHRPGSDRRFSGRRPRSADHYGARL